MQTNTLYYKASVNYRDGDIYGILDVEIRLDDQCKNKHCDIHMTASGWEKQGDQPIKIDRYFSYGGCCHGEILKHFPQFKIFADLHGCTHRGVPMYPTANGMYHIKRDDKAAAMGMLRITEEEYDAVKECVHDELYFLHKLEELGVQQRWHEEAHLAISTLTRLINDRKRKEDPVSFGSNKVRWQNPYSDEIERIDKYLLTEEDRVVVSERFKIGYYTPEEIQRRKWMKDTEKIEKARMETYKDYINAIRKAMTQRDVELCVLDHGLPIDNFIFYNHTGIGVFNWKSYGDMITQEQFDAFIEISKRKLPNVKFQFGESKK